MSLRISDRATAEANIGGVCTYGTKDGREYGRILRVTATELVLERLHHTDKGDFVPHPVAECPRSRNRVTYQTRDVRLVHPPAPFAFNVPEEAPAPPPVSADAARIAALERQVALLTEAVTMLLTEIQPVFHGRCERAAAAVASGVVIDLAKVEELQTNAAKTDTLLAALRPTA